MDDSQYYEEMPDHFDIIIIGSGLVNCMISGMLSVAGYKVLTFDQSEKYGGECSTMDFTALNEVLGDQKVDESFGAAKLWNVDRIMKFIVAGGDMVKMIKACTLYNHLQLFKIECSLFVLNSTITKVPQNKTEVMCTSALGMWERGKLVKFMYDMRNVNFDAGQLPIHFTHKTTTKEVFDHYGLSERVQHLLGHVIALHPNDDYLKLSCVDTYKKIKCYEESMMQAEKCPFLYPAYGISDVPQAFSRRACTLNGIFGMGFNYKINFDETTKEFKSVSLGKEGKKVVTADKLLTDPTALKDMTVSVGKIIRCICIMKQPIMYNGTPLLGAQIIYPGCELKKRSDLYIGLLSSNYRVCPENCYLALVATPMETDNPEKEIEPGVRLLGKVERKVMFVDEEYHPVPSKMPSNVFISKSCDTSTHYETSCDEIRELWQKITGKPLCIDEIDRLCKSKFPDCV